MYRLLIVPSLLAVGPLAGCNYKGGEDPPAADTAADTAYRDGDGDGYSELDGDCDDANPDINPGAEELPNGIDDNCSGQIDEGSDRYDDDGDGYSEDQGDCDDADASRGPGTEEVPYDGVDQDCDGADLTDVDGDGYDSELAGGSDCDDADPAVNPGAEERPNGIDDNCDTLVDEGFTDDADGDGYTADDGDCDDADAATYPGASERIGDGVDNDCNGLTDDIGLDDTTEITGDYSGTYFGLSISAGDFDGDGVQDLAVGAQDDSEGAYRAGQTWVIPGDTAGGLGNDVAQLSFVGGQSDALLGATVEFVPDMDGDGDDELLIGAPYASLGFSTSSEGLTYLVAGDPDGYGLQLPVGTTADDVLRGGVRNANIPDAIAAGDWNADGFGDFALGNTEYSAGSTDQGAAFIFDGSVGPGGFGTAVVAEAAEAIITGPDPWDLLGYQLEGIPDIDGDGYEEVLIATTSSGEVYLFDGDDLSAPSSEISASSATTIFANTGLSTWGQALTAGDFDGDGDTDIALADTSGDGAVAIFDNGGSGFSGYVPISSADATIYGQSDAFGYSMSSGDVDSDGMDELLVGAYTFSELADDAGAVFIFDLEDLAAADGATHIDYGRPLASDVSGMYLGWSLTISDAWWATGVNDGSDWTDPGSVYMVPFTK